MDSEARREYRMNMVAREDEMGFDCEWGKASEGMVNSGLPEASKQRDETQLLQREAGADMYSGVMWFVG
jgi:hypothetical protein